MHSIEHKGLVAPEYEPSHAETEHSTQTTWILPDRLEFRMVVVV